MTTMSISKAASKGLAALVTSAEEGNPTQLLKSGRVVAEIDSTEEFSALRQDRDTLHDAALALARLATDTRTRTDLDQALELFGLTRDELEAEIATDIDTGRA